MVIFSNFQWLVSLHRGNQRHRMHPQSPPTPRPGDGLLPRGRPNRGGFRGHAWPCFDDTAGTHLLVQWVFLFKRLLFRYRVINKCQTCCGQPSKSCILSWTDFFRITWKDVLLTWALLWTTILESRMELMFAFQSLTENTIDSLTLS